MKWVESRKGELLPIDYHHVVFTIPEQLNDLVLRNKPLLYKILFAASAATLQTIAADPRHLGAQIGFLFRIAQLGTKSVVSSPYPLRCHRWRYQPRRNPLGLFETRLLPAGPGAVPPLPAALPRSSRRRFPEKSPLFPWKDRGTQGTRRFLRANLISQTDRMGRLQ